MNRYTSLTEMDSGYEDFRKGVLKLKRFYRGDRESLSDEIASILLDELDDSTLNLIKVQI